MSDPQTPQHGAFPATQWTLIGRAGGEADQEALQELLNRYLPALRVHLISKYRIDAHRIDDLLQGFVCDKMLEKDLLARADKARGKFRSLLRSSLDHYVASSFRYERAQKRSKHRTLHLDAHEGMDIADPDGDTASPGFDAEWARTVLSHALDLMRADCGRIGRNDLWDVFQGRVVGPILRGEPPVPYETLIERFGFRSPTQASNTLITAKRMYARAVKKAVGPYAGDDGETELELRELMQVLMGNDPPSRHTP